MRVMSTPSYSLPQQNPSMTTTPSTTMSAPTFKAASTPHIAPKFGNVNLPEYIAYPGLALELITATAALGWAGIATKSRLWDRKYKVVKAVYQGAIHATSENTLMRIKPDRVKGQPCLRIINPNAKGDDVLLFINKAPKGVTGDNIITPGKGQISPGENLYEFKVVTRSGKPLTIVGTEDGAAQAALLSLLDAYHGAEETLAPLQKVLDEAKQAAKDAKTKTAAKTPQDGKTAEGST